MSRAPGWLAAVCLAILGAGAAVPCAWAQAAEPTPAGASQDTFLRTLRRDIEGASYYELLALCRELGLEDTGDRQALQARLLQHYALESQEGQPEKEVRVEIVSARDTDYFTVEAVDEDYVLLRGGVVVRVTDRDGESVHTIEAEEIVYNQTTASMTARGGARYVLSRGGKDEVFVGESLSFDTESHVGVFYRGTVVREREVSGLPLTFTFKGEAMSRLENDTVILDDATITSSKPVDPYYSIRARRAWILAEGEWAVSGATLRVGRVPVFYVPFFLLPGDELVFHPSMEVRQREGTVIQTTTYLLGQRKRSTDSLSLLRLTEEPEAGYRRVRRGMFLTVDPENKAPVESQDRYVAVMADLYTRLGGMVGVDVKLPPQYTGRLGLGVSRSIFRDGSTGAYTPYWDDPEQGYVSVWNTTSIAGATLPFRFGVESTLALTGPPNLSAAIELYADPYFSGDFYTRSDSLNWDKLLSGTATTAGTTAVRSNLVWTASTAYNLGPLLNTPLMTELAIRSLDLRLTLASRTVDTSGDPLLGADPARTFYYPVLASAPTLRLGLQGTLLSLPAARSASGDTPRPSQPAEADEEKGTGIRVPGDEPEPVGEAETGPEDDETHVLLPSNRGDITVARRGASNTVRITYAISPTIAVEHPFATADWSLPADVDLGTNAVTLSTQAEGTIGLRVGLADGVLGLSTDLQSAGIYRTRYPGSEAAEAADLAARQLQDYKDTKLTVSERSSLTLKPLIGVEYLSESSLVYTFAWNILSTSFDKLVADVPVYTTLLGDVTKDTVTAHSLAATIAFKPRVTSHTLTLTAVLPPEDATLSARLASTLGPASATLQGGARLVDDVWKTDPLAASISYAPFDWLSLTQTGTYDTEEARLDSLSSTAKVADFSVRLETEHMKPVDPFGATKDEPEALLAKSLRFEYNLTPARVGYLWRNRIRIEAQATAAWAWSLQRFTDNALTVSLKLSLQVYRFLTLELGARSANTKMYQYFPDYAEELDIPWVNPVYDLLRSFNFFDEGDRRSSAFKAKEVSLTLLHHMPDWDFRLEYAGKPQLGEGATQYEWGTTFSLLLQWKPLPLVRARARGDTTGFYLREGGE
jgi:hypothetical protein